jgi:hypothetical protein
VLQKPPIGLRPRWLVDDQRLEEIIAAVIRYIYAGYPIPIEWAEELNELTVRKNQRKEKENPNVKVT